MAFSIKKLKKSAEDMLVRRRKELEPRDDIKRDNLDIDAEKDQQNFRFSSVIDHIKKNLEDLKSLNKKI